MKVVIDINEKDYKFIKSVRSIMKNSDTFQRITADIFFAVKEGTPVMKTKLHGRTVFLVKGDKEADNDK